MNNESASEPQKADETLLSTRRGEEIKVLKELLSEAVGLDKGLIRTFLDLRTNPRQVLESYQAGDRRYVSPFRLLIASMSLWILINGFFIDWYSIWKELMSMAIHGQSWLTSYMNDYSEEARNALTLKLSQKTAPVMDIYCRFTGDLFSKWYVPFTLVSIILGSIHYTRRQSSGGLSLRNSLYILSYSISANIPVYLLLSILFWMNVGVALAACFIMLLFNFMGYSQLISFAPIRSFVMDNGKTIEKQIMQSVTLVVMIVMILLAAGYMAYYILI